MAWVGDSPIGRHSKTLSPRGGVLETLLKQQEGNKNSWDRAQRSNEFGGRSTATMWPWSSMKVEFASKHGNQEPREQAPVLVQAKVDDGLADGICGGGTK